MTMARVEGVDPGHLSDEYTAKVLEAQARTWGAPLLNHLVYARRPSIFRGARGMWAGIDGSGVDPRHVDGAPQPPGRGAERLRVLTGHQRCGRQQTGPVRCKDPGAGRLRH